MKNERAFIIAEINGRYNDLIKAKDYAVLGQCTVYKDFISKIGLHVPTIEECTAENLKGTLYSLLWKEIGEFRDENVEAIDYLRDRMFIEGFFETLLTGLRSPLADEIIELKVLETCRSFEEIRKLCINRKTLRSIYRDVKMRGEVTTNKLYTMHYEVLKNYFDFYFQKTENPQMKRIIEIEATRVAYEVLINFCTKGVVLDNIRNYVPGCASIPGTIYEKLTQSLTEAELAAILGLDCKDVLKYALERQACAYLETFLCPDDVSCVYAYFQLKNQEIKNILWISDCILLGNYEQIDEFIKNF